MLKLGKLNTITPKEVIMAIKGVKFSEEHKQKLREAAAKRDKTTYKGRKFIEGQSAWNKGISPSQEARKKMSDSKIKAGIKPPPRWGYKPWNYEGAKTKACRENRRCLQDKKWRLACLERDKYECQQCGKTEKLHVHHIKGWVDFPHLRFDESNGITYCANCHLKLTWEEKKKLKVIK